jgi:hypothetical protein
VKIKKSRSRFRGVTLVLLWVWAILVFVVIDLFFNVEEFDAVRPRNSQYRAIRYVAHQLVGERYPEDDEFSALEATNDGLDTVYGLFGHVRGNGSPVEGATVLLMEERTGALLSTSRTDARGAFSTTIDGHAMVCRALVQVRAAGYVPTEPRVVQLRRGRRRRESFDLVSGGCLQGRIVARRGNLPERLLVLAVPGARPSEDERIPLVERFLEDAQSPVDTADPWPASAYTNPSGTFRVEGLADDAYGIVLYSPAWVLEQAIVMRTGDAPVELVAAPAFMLRGNVRGADVRRPLARFTVTIATTGVPERRLRGRGGEYAVRWIGDDKRRTYDVSVASPGYQTATRQIVLGPDRAAARLSVQLQPDLPPNVRLLINNMRDRAPAGRIRAYYSGRSRPAWSELDIVPQGSGNFLASLAPGRWRLRVGPASDARFLSVDTTVNVAESGMSDVEVTMPASGNLTVLRPTDEGEWSMVLYGPAISDAKGDARVSLRTARLSQVETRIGPMRSGTWRYRIERGGTPHAEGMFDVPEGGKTVRVEVPTVASVAK